MTQPVPLGSAPDFWGAWPAYLGFCWRKQKQPWCCPDSPAPICCPGSHHTGFLQCWLLFSFQVESKLYVLVCPLELRPPWWYCKGGLCAMALFSSLAGVLWGVQRFVCVRNPSGIVLELDLLEIGPWWKPSLHNTFPTYRQWWLAQSKSLPQPVLL